MTTRIQRIRHIKGWKAPPNTLNITRPGRHGNPYPVVDGDIDLSLKQFETYLDFMECNFPERYINLLREVARADFVMCFCPIDNPCHGDIWIERAKEYR